jgi:hypothetical protein
VTLNHHPDFPSARYDVLKLHRDSSQASGLLKGRLEHVATGQQFDFASAAALLYELLKQSQGAAVHGETVSDNHAD